MFTMCKSPHSPGSVVRRPPNLSKILFNRSAHSTGPGSWGMGNLTSNGRWTRGKCQEHLKQGRGRWRERPEERDSLPSSSGDQLACARRVRRYFRGGACSHEGLRLPTCSSLLQSTKMGKWLQGRGPGVSWGPPGVTWPVIWGPWAVAGWLLDCPGRS